MKVKQQKINIVESILLGVVLSIVGVLIFSFCVTVLPSNNDVTNAPQQARSIEYVECGCCGAHVIEWWKTRNDADTEWINVCSKCYDAIEEERTLY